MNLFWNFDPLKKRPRVAKGLLLLIWAWAGWLRINCLDISPPGLYADEVSIGYNAYSILKTGKDEFGVSWPLFFRAFGEYKNPVFIYSLVPLIYIKGLLPETVRMGAAVWGGLAIPALSLVAINLSNNWTWSILATLTMTMMPWHLHYSRLGFEAISLPTLLLICFWMFLKWIKDKKIIFGLGFGTSLVLGFYSYTIARLWIPLFLVMLVIIFRKKWPNRHQISIMLGLMGTMMLPLVGWLKKYPTSLMSRMSQIAIWADKPKLIELLRRFVTTYGEHLSHNFLFLRGDTTLRHSSGISSELLISWVLFLIIGLVVAINKLIKQPIWQLIVIMIGLFPLAASLTQTSPIATRTIQATPFFALIIGLGMWWSLKKLKDKKFWLVLFLGAWIILIGLEFNHYYQDLIYQYPKRVWMPWHGFDGSLPEAITWTYEESMRINQNFYLSDKIEQAYIQGLFFTRADPRLWQKEKLAYFKVDSFDRVDNESVWLITNQECKSNKATVILKKFGIDTDNYDYCAVKILKSPY